MKTSSRSIRTRAFFLILVWILLLAVSLTLLSVLLATYLQNPQVQSVISLSWSGYVVASDFSNPQPTVIGINASWTVPTVNASSSDSYSSAWIGIGGQFDKSLIQLGTEHDYTNGQERYVAWYELLPNYAVEMFNVSAGDAITSSINLINSDTNEWNLHLADFSNGQEFNQNFFYNSTRLSGEWIVERPTLSNQITTLADFGSITFSGAYSNINHEVKGLGYSPYAQVHMTNRQNTQLTTVSSPIADRSSFTVGFLTSG